MENFILREADINDIALLTELRLTYLRADRGSLTETEEAALRKVLPDYFARNLGTMFFAYIIEIDGRAVSAAYMAVSEKPANPAFITGKIGTILNVYTDPAYRRRGLAAQVLKKLIERAKEENLSKIELSATADGRPVYEKLGFAVKQSAYTDMQLRLQ